MLTAPELLAPAGDLDCVRAAIENGADAVYFGLDCGFNARARAANFRLDELSALMRLLHLRGLRGYATLNTLVFADEWAEFDRAVAAVAEAGVDAVLVQDVGAARRIRESWPGLPLHASTQMTLTSAETIRLAEELGMERVVVARELSLDEIVAIRRHSSMPLEVFVHGALCVAYSGQCLTSESLGGRSANRGQCAQACRLPYELVCDGRDVELGALKYLLSPQDLAAYALVPELLAAGVAALKIEGRLKTPEYVANVTRHYRTAIDSAVAGRPVVFTPREVEDLELSFSRGFSPGWLRGCDHKMLVPALSSAKRGVRVGTVAAVRGGRVAVDLAAGLAGGVKRGDGVAFDSGATSDDATGGRVYEVFQAGRSCTAAVVTGRVDLAFGSGTVDLEAVRPGQAVWKTEDPHLTARLRKSFSGAGPSRRQAVDLHVTVAPGEPVRVAAVTAGGTRVEIVSESPAREATKHAIDVDVLRGHLGRLGGTPFELRHLTADIAGRTMVPFSVLGLVRHQLVRRLEEAVASHSLRDNAHSHSLSLRDGAHSHSLSLRERAGVRVPPTDTPDGDTLTRPSATLSRRERDEAWVLPVDATDGDTLTPPSAARSRWDRGEARVPPADTPRSDILTRVPGEQVEKALPALHLLVRSLEQVRAALDLGERSLQAEFADIRLYREAVAACRAAGATLALATPRIQKPDELGIFRVLARQEPDAVLVRNWAGLAFFRDLGLPVIADFALNVANEMTADFFLAAGCRRVTASYDLNREQLLALAAAADVARLEVVIHQRMPLFHMEHCVFCAVLSPGTNKTNCGRPCDDHVVHLRDRIGVAHPLTADVGCRNTLWNAVPQSAAEAVPALLARGVRHVRVEILDEHAADIGRIVRAYRDLLAGRVTGREVWTALKAANRVGVTRGTLEERRNPLAIV